MSSGLLKYMIGAGNMAIPSVRTTLPVSALAGTLISILLCGQAFALTVYDVIQLSSKNYSDNEIIKLIQATNSAFKLTAEDLPRLLEAGVNDSVIQVMLTTTPDNTRTPTENINITTVPTSSTAVFATAVKQIAGGHFVYDPVQEAGSAHHHGAISLAGIRVFIVRDEAAFPSIEARARRVVKQLEQASMIGEGSFHPGHFAGGSSIEFHGEKIHSPLIILKVTTADAYAYQRRSGRTLTPDILAAYWSDLLSDYWSITINKVAPTRLAGLHEGEALIALHEQWTSLSSTSTAQLADAAQRLPRQEQQHLLHLATTVPRDYLINPSHLAE